MSLILDAIKKSERERQQQEVPGLASNHEEYQSAESSRNRWPQLVGLLILILVIYLLVSKDWFTAEQQMKLTPVATKTIDKTVKQEIQSQPIQMPQKAAQKKANITQQRSVLAPKKTVADAKNIVSLDPDLESKLPSINFSSHVYTGNSATSFVVLNDQLLGVGEKYNEDLEIVQINKDGMVVLFEDQQIFIKALENINP